MSDFFSPFRLFLLLAFSFFFVILHLTSVIYIYINIKRIYNINTSMLHTWEAISYRWSEIVPFSHLVVSILFCIFLNCNFWKINYLLCVFSSLLWRFYSAKSYINDITYTYTVIIGIEILHSQYAKKKTVKWIVYSYISSWRWRICCMFFVFRVYLFMHNTEQNAYNTYIPSI